MKVLGLSQPLVKKTQFFLLYIDETDDGKRRVKKRELVRLAIAKREKEGCWRKGKGREKLRWVKVD